MVLSREIKMRVFILTCAKRPSSTLAAWTEVSLHQRLPGWTAEMDLHRKRMKKGHRAAAAGSLGMPLEAALSSRAGAQQHEKCLNDAAASSCSMRAILYLEILSVNWEGILRFVLQCQSEVSALIKKYPVSRVFIKTMITFLKEATILLNIIPTLKRHKTQTT